MRPLLNRLCLLIAVSVLPLLSNAQNTPVDSLSKDLFKSSNRYMENNTEYRVVKRTVLDVYFGEIKSIDQEKTHTINTKEDEIVSLNDKISSQNKAYNALNTQYQDLLKINDGIEFLSLVIPKRQYSIIVWSLVAILIAFIVILLIMFRKNMQLTRHAKVELNEKIEEFDAYRKRTLKREQEVASGYVREINKLKERINGI